MLSAGRFHYRGLTGLGVSLTASRVAQAVSFLLMARFLSAADMGKVALFSALFIGMFQLTNLGFERYVVYAPGADLDETVDAVWTLQLIRAAFVLAAVAPIYLVMGLFPQLGLTVGEIVAVAGAVSLFSFVNPGLSVFERTGNFAYAARARGISTVAGAVFLIAVMFVWRTPNAYIVSQVVNALLLIWLSHRFADRRPQITLDRARIGEVIGYTRHLVLIAAVSLIASQAQNIYVGALFGAAVLGMYYTWYRLVSLPGEFVTQMQDRLLFAKASDLSRMGQRKDLAHLAGFSFSMVALVPFYAFIWFHGDMLMTVLAGARWLPFWWVGKMFVCISFLLSVCGSLTPFVLVSLPKLSSRMRLAETLIGFSLLLLLGPRMGVQGILIALLIEMCLATVGRTYLLYRHILTEKRIAHAAWAVATLLIIAVPLIAWEACLELLPPGTWHAWASASFYAAWILILTASGWRQRHRLDILRFA